MTKPRRTRSPIQEKTGDLFFPPSEADLRLREARRAVAKKRKPAAIAPNPRADVLAFLDDPSLALVFEHVKRASTNHDIRVKVFVLDCTRRRLAKALKGTGG